MLMRLLLGILVGFTGSKVVAFRALPVLKQGVSRFNFPTSSRPRSVSHWPRSSQHPQAGNLIRRDMCGVVAVVEDVWTSSPVSANGAVNGDAHDADLLKPSVLKSATEILQHRGPDGMQIHTTPEASSSTTWGMGHTRLAIVDPANRKADMPFRLEFGDDRVIHLAANGEIYNHKTLYDSMVTEDGGWDHPRVSGSDCEVIAHAYAKYGGPEAVTKLDGMFAFVVFEEGPDGKIQQAFAARDPVGIKPLYYGRSVGSGAYVFASELKALAGHVDPASVVAVPPGHYWTPDTGLVCYYNPDWLRKQDYAPWKDADHSVEDDEIRQAFTKAVQKRMMADVEYGFFLSGGIDSCVVAHDLLPLYRAEREARGDYRPIHTYTVGMENSPDVMAAKAMVEALGGPKYVNHHVRTFTPEEVFDLIPKIVYHMETYEAELIRSSIPNWLLAERASQDVKMVLTGEGADELFAGYLYFQDAENSQQLQDELRRIYGMLGNINLHRTDRMTMAHGLEARVPFLDTEFTRLVMSVDPQRKMVDPEAVKANARGREKTLLRELFEGPNANGDSIPRPVLWRAKAMQCEGVGEDWVAILQEKIASLVTDEEMAEASVKYPVNTPHTKEELYYRRIFDEHFHGMEHVVKLWEGGGRAMGAAWKSDMYTREGLKNVNLLSHSLQKKEKSLATAACEEFCDAAKVAGYNEFEALLTSGGDDRTYIKADTKTNKYHIRPQPIASTDIFRGACTGNPPTARGYDAAEKLYKKVFEGVTDRTQVDAALRNVFADQRERIKKVLNLPAGSEVVLCPSGSDAEYIPVAIAKTLRPDATITNGVTQLKEVGAGSAPAAMGRYFSTYSPLLGKLPENQEHLQGFQGIDGTIISARDMDGSVVASCDKMDEFCAEALEKGLYPISHAVFGGKTGLRDRIVPRSLEGGDRSLGVVDACQGRFSQAELHEWLEQDSLVLFTGSKFYQGPPFSGAVIVPPTIADKLRQVESVDDSAFFTGLGGFLTDKEVPESFPAWTANLKQQDASNVGLGLRWEAALAGMEALAHVPDEDRTKAVDTWAAAVGQMVDEAEGLESWCVERSIVSIRVASKKEEASWMDMADLRDLYRWMSMNVADRLPEATQEERDALSTAAYIGQPVDVSAAHGIVRIALGVDSLLSYMDNEEATLEEDRATIRKMAAICKYFDKLKAFEQPPEEAVAPVAASTERETSSMMR